MLTLIGLTCLSLYLVATNMLLLLAGWRTLPSAEVEGLLSLFRKFCMMRALLVALLAEPATLR